MCDSRLGFIVSAALDPIPHRLVQRIRNGEFVEMRKLLADNISLYNQLEDFCGHTSGLRSRVREVPSLSLWVYCFAAYMARCWPTAGSLFVRHLGMGAMAGLSMIEPFGVSQRWIHLCLGICLFLVCWQLPFYALAHLGDSFARCAASPITQPVSVPFQLSSLQRILVVADCCSGLE